LSRKFPCRLYTLPSLDAFRDFRAVNFPVTFFERNHCNANLELVTESGRGIIF
jgi:hypothetical protein